jgi:hypothetical protein
MSKLLPARWIAAALLSLGVAAGASAQDDAGWYFSPGGQVDPDPIGTPHLLGGYQFGSHFALELEYKDRYDKWLSEDRYEQPAAFESDLFHPDLGTRPDGVGLRAVGILPLRENFSAFGKAGLFSYSEPVDFGRNRTRIEGYELPGFIDPAAQTGTDLTVGAGMRYDFRERLGLRFEWERFSDFRESRDSDMLGIGLDYRLD